MPRNLPKKPVTKPPLFSETKFVIGIVIPLFVVILLIIISNAGGEAYASVSTATSININDLYYDSYDYSIRPPYSLVQTITIKNDNLLPRKYELPKVIGCVASDQFTVVYSPSEERANMVKVPIVGILASDAKSIYSDYYRYESLNYVEVPAKGEKVVHAFIVPKGVYQLSKNKAKYNQSGELLLVETPHPNKQRYTYYSCQSLLSNSEMEGWEKSVLILN